MCGVNRLGVKWFETQGVSLSRKTESSVRPRASRGLVGHSHVTIGLIASNGRGVHSPRCLPSHLPNNGKVIESRHIPVLMLPDAFHGDVDACSHATVTVVLMGTRPTVEPLLVAVRTLRMPAHRTPLTRVLGVNPSSWNALERRFVRRVVLKSAEWEVVQASVHPRAVVDTVTHLFEVFTDNTRLLKLTAPRCADSPCGVGRGQPVPHALPACRGYSLSPRSGHASAS